MAFVPLTPVTLNVTMTQGYGQAFNSGIVMGPTGAAINLSAWTDLVATIVDPSVGPASGSATFGTVTAAATGVVTLTVSPTDLATVPSGSAKLILSGKPTSGDTVQVLTTGVLTLNPG
jgi:hypothetical protein